MIFMPRQVIEIENSIPEVCTHRPFMSTLHEADHSVSLSIVCLGNEQI